MKYLLAAMLVLIASAAHTQQIRDMSLTPDESLRQPDVSNSDTQPLGGTWSNNFGINNEGAGHIQNFQSGNMAYEGQQTRYFMESYCNQNNNPLIRSQQLSNMTGCIEDIKAKACDAFRRLPEDAKTSVDGATECIFSMEDTPYTETKACGQFERGQLALVKKYWGSPDVAYAILFIPDMVSSPHMFCNRR
ncbi:MAG: hypothetical protein ACK502_04955 [Alphaproteobacteria bacterium]